MKKNGALDIICKIISVLLSIVFVVMLIVTALFYSDTNVLKHETLTEIITDIDFSELLSDSVIEGVKEKYTTLSFKPVVLMGGTFKNESTGQKITISPYGEVQYETPVQANGNSSQKGSVVSSGDGIFVVEDGSSTAIIGGSDGPTSVIVAPSQNSGSSAESAFDALMENFSENEVKIIESFLESDVAKEVLDEYANVISDVISGKETQLDKEKIKQIIIDNKEEIITFIEANTQGEQVNAEEFSKEIEKFLDENIDEVINVLPEPIEVVKSLPTEVIEIINIINSGIILNALFTVDAIIALLIFVLRLWDFAGFLWLSVDGIISGILLAFIYLSVNVFKGMFLDLVPTGQAVISSVFNAITNRLFMSLAVILIAAILFMVIFFIIKKSRRK